MDYVTFFAAVLIYIHCRSLLDVTVLLYCVLWGKDCISTSFKYSHVLHKEMEFSSQLVSNFFRT